MEKVILGNNAVFSTDPAVTGINNNVLVCGSSGSGKTFSITEPRLLATTGTSLVVTLTKRRLVSKYTPLFKERGYDVYDLNFAKPAKSGVAYDPLRYVKNYSDITFLAESIVRSSPEKGNFTNEKYWDDTSISLLSSEIYYVKATNEHATFNDVLDFHSQLSITSYNDSIQTSHDEKFDELERKDPGNFGVRCWKTFSQLNMRTAGCVYSTLNTTLDTIFTPELRRLIGQKNKLNFDKLGQKKSLLFVTSSPVNPSLHCFVNMFYAQMFKQLFEYAENRDDGVLPVPVHVVCDDFATGGRIYNFPEYISIFREKGLSATLLLQSESQLESIYGAGDATTIINNCDTYVYLGGSDIKTAQNMSIRLNAPLEDILYMPIGREIIFRRGQRPIVTERYSITEDSIYQRITNGADTAADK